MMRRRVADIARDAEIAAYSRSRRSSHDHASSFFSIPTLRQRRPGCHQDSFVLALEFQSRCRTHWRNQPSSDLLRNLLVSQRIFVSQRAANYFKLYRIGGALMHPPNPLLE